MTIATLLVVLSRNADCTPVIGAADARKYSRRLSHVNRRICGWRGVGLRRPR
ncbi:hypothetical protein OHB09_32690 (plasmid) [Streptomyces jietaisiensis]|nr:hypothetical protein [Streptomyces jietaisiensis]